MALWHAEYFDLKRLEVLRSKFSLITCLYISRVTVMKPSIPLPQDGSQKLELLFSKASHSLEKAHSKTHFRGCWPIPGGRIVIQRGQADSKQTGFIEFSPSVFEH
jgi:hypothetical protein